MRRCKGGARPCEQSSRLPRSPRLDSAATATLTGEAAAAQEAMLYDTVMGAAAGDSCPLGVRAEGRSTQLLPVLRVLHCTDDHMVRRPLAAATPRPVQQRPQHSTLSAHGGWVCAGAAARARRVLGPSVGGQRGLCVDARDQPLRGAARRVPHVTGRGPAADTRPTGQRSRVGMEPPRRPGGAGAGVPHRGEAPPASLVLGGLPVVGPSLTSGWGGWRRGSRRCMRQ
jgi:hypothetical protein